MKIKVIAFGKNKDERLKSYCEEFAKRSNRWAEVSETELKPSHVESIEQARKKEAESLLAAVDKLPRGSKVILLDEQGKAHKTETWADKFQQFERDSVPQLALCLGGSYGFSDELDFERWSLGPQTLSHLLARTVLHEQIYRTLSLKNGHPYHHA